MNDNQIKILRKLLDGDELWITQKPIAKSVKRPYISWIDHARYVPDSQRREVHRDVMALLKKGYAAVDPDPEYPWYVHDVIIITKAGKSVIRKIDD